MRLGVGVSPRTRVGKIMAAVAHYPLGIIQMCGEFVGRNQSAKNHV